MPTLNATRLRKLIEEAGGQVEAEADAARAEDERRRAAEDEQRRSSAERDEDQVLRQEFAARADEEQAALMREALDHVAPHYRARAEAAGPLGWETWTRIKTAMRVTADERR